VIATVTETTGTGLQTAGLWDDHTELAVRAFRVREL
jgi:hypothetical protein